MEKAYNEIAKEHGEEMADILVATQTAIRRSKRNMLDKMLAVATEALQDQDQGQLEAEILGLARRRDTLDQVWRLLDYHLGEGRVTLPAALAIGFPPVRDRSSCASTSRSNRPTSRPSQSTSYAATLASACKAFYQFLAEEISGES